MPCLESDIICERWVRQLESRYAFSSLLVKLKFSFPHVVLCVSMHVGVDISLLRWLNVYKFYETVSIIIYENVQPFFRCSLVIHIKQMKLGFFFLFFWEGGGWGGVYTCFFLY